MDDRTYLFIDGEYLRQIHREAMQVFFGVDGELEVSPLMQMAQASRAYFYDSLDEAPREDEDESARLARIAPLKKFFEGVRGLKGFHVRLGTVTGHAKRRRQKQVDILLAVDMLTHGFNRSMEKAVLLAGDLDFKPIVETLVRNGVFVDVWYHSTSIARDLADAADFGGAFSFSQLHSLNTMAFKEAHPIPRDEQHGGVPYGDLVKVGTVVGHAAELRRHLAPEGPSPLSFWITIEPGRLICVRDSDEKLIEKYVAAQYGPIQWELGEEDLREMSDRAKAAGSKRS